MDTIGFLPTGIKTVEKVGCLFTCSGFLQPYPDRLNKFSYKESVALLTCCKPLQQQFEGSIDDLLQGTNFVPIRYTLIFGCSYIFWLFRSSTMIDPHLFLNMHFKFFILRYYVRHTMNVSIVSKTSILIQQNWL